MQDIEQWHQMPLPEAIQNGEHTIKIIDPKFLLVVWISSFLLKSSIMEPSS